MIKKALFEDEIIEGMQKNLKNETSANIEIAIQDLEVAADIFKEYNLNNQANQIYNIIQKIAKKRQNPEKISDRHIKGLTPEKQVKNLLHHGTQFNMSDDMQMLDEYNIDELLAEDLDKKQNLLQSENEGDEVFELPDDLDFEDETD